jgi:hypothetical protein
VDENTRNFLDFWKTYTWPEPEPVFYRLYHTDSGEPVVYSMEDLPGKYIEVTAAQYQEHSYRVRVVDNKLVKQPLNLITTKKLIPADIGTACHPADITIVTDTYPNQKWKLKIYDNN